MKPWNVILATVIIFGSGFVAGALVSRHHQSVAQAEQLAAVNARNPAPPWQIQRVEFLRKIEKNLNLTAEQKQKIEKIMRDSLERTKPLWSQIAPEMREELVKVREDIRAELTPEQNQKFESLLKPRPRKLEEGSSEEKRRRVPKAQPVQIPAESVVETNR